MAIRFKFRSAVEFDSVDVEGPSISVRDLKGKIAEHKKLSTCIDFDLVITNAESGEEYNDDSISVPQNTSVIIKRVPAARPKSNVVLPDVESLVKASSVNNTNKDDIQWSSSLPIADNNGFGDFGVDLYADSENCLPEKYTDGTDNIGGMVNKTDMDTQRQRSRMLEQDELGKTISRGHTDHCPTNGDAVHNIKKAELSVHITKIKSKDQDVSYNTPDRLVTRVKSNEMAFAKKADAILPMMSNSELPSELKCSLCQAIFKDAVMIPCCQFSFCHECIRLVLIEKGRCPQCNSTKFKSNELLPNIALRQAIEHFLESQVTVSSAEDCAAKHAPDGESAIQAKGASHALSNIQGLSEGKKSIVDNGEDGKLSKVPQSLSHKNERITMESQASKGKKRKKPLHPSATDGTSNFVASGRLKKGCRCCYVCGSPDHLARDCPDNAAPFSQPGMFDGGGPMYPGSIPAYGPDAYWHGTSVSHVRPFPNMYGPTPPAMPFEAPMLPVAPYAIPPYMPSMYAGVPIHCGFMRMGSIGPALVTPSERPLSREEFMELQERERWRRLTQEQHDRERIREKDNSLEGDSRDHCLETQRSWYDQRQVSKDDRHVSYSKCDVDGDSVGNYSNESNYDKSRSGRHTLKYSREKYPDSNAFHRQDSISDESDYQMSRSKRRMRKYSQEKFIDSDAYEGTNSVSDESYYQKSKSGRHAGKQSQEKYANFSGCQKQISMAEDEDNLSVIDRKGRIQYAERWHAYSKSLNYNSRNHGRQYLEDGMDRSTSELEEYGREPTETCNNLHRESGYLKTTKHSASSRSKKNIMLQECGSPKSSYASRYRSRKDTSEDLKHTSYHKKNAKKYSSSEYIEEDERVSLYEYHSPKEDKLERSVQDERSKNSHHKKQSHLISEYDGCFSSEQSKRRKKHKNDQRNSLDRTRDTWSHVLDDSDVHASRHHKHESKSNSQQTGSILDPVEESRWKMDTGFDNENEDVYYMYHTKDKQEHSHKKKAN